MLSLPPIARSRLSTASCTAGLALATYLALLKGFALPCIGPGNCHAILYSAFGTVFGLPVGCYGALLWAGAMLVPDRTKRGLLLALLAAGATIFMFIQFFVLRGFCLYCTLHAAAAWTALAFHGAKPHGLSVLLALALAAGGFQLNRHAAVRAGETAVASPLLSALPDDPAGLAWLGPVHPRSPALVLSLDCAACLDLLESLTLRSYAGTHAGPAVYFKTNDTNRAVTEVFLAAALALHDLSRRDAFLTVSTALLAEKDTALSGPETAAARLAAFFPASAARRADAARLLDAQTGALKAAAVGEITPQLIPRDGRTRVLFDADALFPR